MNGSIFGGGYLLSDRAIAEKVIAEKIELSDREKALVKALKNTPRGYGGTDTVTKKHSRWWGPALSRLRSMHRKNTHGGISVREKKQMGGTNPRTQNGTLRKKYRARFRAAGAPCGMCKGKLGPIHHDEPGSPAHPLSFVIDEIKPVSRWREFGYHSAREAAEDFDNL